MEVLIQYYKYGIGTSKQHVLDDSYFFIFWRLCVLKTFLITCLLFVINVTQFK